MLEFKIIEELEPNTEIIEPIEGQVVKEIFELCKQGKSTRGIATIMRNNNSYLKTGKWTSDRIYKILTNSIYIGIFEYGKYCRKPQDILIVKDYCEPIIDEETWKITRANLEKNKHPNYGEHIHLFTGIIKCPNCGKILSSTNSYKNSRNPHAKIYYHVTCKNPNCKSKGIHYSSDKIEEKLARVLNELTRYMYDIESEIIVCNSIKTKDIKGIDNAIEKLKQQEKKLVDLYLSSTLNFETINHRNDLIKKEIENLNKKKQQIDPYDELKDYTVELLKKLDCDVENDKVISNNKLAFSFVFNSLNRQAKKELIKKLFDKIEIKRTKNYEVEITNIKFTEEFISKSSKTYLKYLDEILQNNNIGFIYKESIDIQELKKLQENYFIFSCRKMENEEYSQTDLEKYMALLEEHFYKDGVITCPYIEDGNVADHLTLIPKIYIYVLASTAFVLPHKFKYGFSTPYPKINMKGTKKKMNDEKVNYLIAMIKDMDIENKLRLAICMSDNSTTHLEYDKKETYKHFDLLLKEINFEYRTTAVNFANYPFIMFAMAKIMEMDSYEQNKVALYLFNSINYKIKKYVNVDETLGNCKQMF